MTSQHPDRIAQFFENKTLLITGATGFVGKVLLEKTLRACSPKKVHILVRAKKSKSPEARLKELLNDPIFEVLRAQKGPGVFAKIELIAGDVALPDLGLTQENFRKIAQHVEIIYHCAAIVRFDVCLSEAIFVNVRGTKSMLDLAKKCANLAGFVHVSTAYCHLQEQVVKEEVYWPANDAHKIIQLCENLESDLVEKIKNELLGDYPNCYPFSKALSESLVSAEMKNLPVVIFRPSVVVPIWKEPLPGYTDNINGPTGLLLGAGKGVIRTLYCKINGYLDYIPADIVANGLLFCVYDFVAYDGQRRIYNAVSSKHHKISFKEVVKMGKSIIEDTLPFNNIVWYPGGSLTESKLKHYTILILFQLLPALFIDFILIMCRLKPLLWKIQKRILNAYSLCNYYINRDWEFDNSKTLEAIENLNPRERQIYKLDGRDGNFRDYFVNCIHCARLYLLKETDDQIPAAKRQMKIMWVLDWLCKIAFVSAVFYIISVRVFG